MVDRILHSEDEDIEPAELVPSEESENDYSDSDESNDKVVVSKFFQDGKANIVAVSGRALSIEQKLAKCAPCLKKGSRCDGQRPCSSCVENLRKCQDLTEEAKEEIRREFPKTIGLNPDDTRCDRCMKKQSTCDGNRPCLACTSSGAVLPFLLITCLPAMTWMIAMRRLYITSPTFSHAPINILINPNGHHFNLVRESLYLACRALVALPLWMASRKRVQIEDRVSLKAVMSSQAAKWVDPPCLFLCLIYIYIYRFLYTLSSPGSTGSHGLRPQSTSFAVLHSLRATDLTSQWSSRSKSTYHSPEPTASEPTVSAGSVRFPTIHRPQPRSLKGVEVSCELDQQIEKEQAQLDHLRP